MIETPPTSQENESEPKERIAHSFQSLKELLNFVSGKNLPKASPESGGLIEKLPYPFLAIIGQKEMKLALLLSLINPQVGGVLLIGPRGTGKTTAVRSLLDLLPKVERSLCIYGCLPEDIETGGLDAVCPDCAKKFGEGFPLTGDDRVRLIELPLNSLTEDVIGSIDERIAITHERLRIHRGILAQSDKNLLYIDEINLLSDEIVDVILDAAAQGMYTVRRGPISASYHSRFVLVGSMNPEEGSLRPQILDRIGLRVLVRGLQKPEERLKAYRRVQSYMSNPRGMSLLFRNESAAAEREITAARVLLPKVKIPDKVAKSAIHIIQQMGIDSLRAEITWFEAARAYAAADARDEVEPIDLLEVAPLALRFRRSQFMTEYINDQDAEEKEMITLLAQLKVKKKVSPGRQ